MNRKTKGPDKFKLVLDVGLLTGTGTQINLAGWTASSSKLTGGNVIGEFTGVQSGAGTTKTFFAGADDNIGTNANFSVEANGNLLAKNADITGAITADSGSIAGILNKGVSGEIVSSSHKLNEVEQCQHLLL